MIIIITYLKKYLFKKYFFNFNLAFINLFLDLNILYIFLFIDFSLLKIVHLNY